METNCAVHFANFSLAVFEILNQHNLNIICSFISRYIDDILALNTIILNKIHIFLNNFYKPLNLNLIQNKPITLQYI
jgi:hypothetical protein